MIKFNIRKKYLLGYDIKWWNKELITDEGEGVKHVDDSNDVENDSAILKLLFIEKVGRKERRIFHAINLWKTLLYKF